MASYECNTSQDKCWIFDSGSTVHVCSQKKLFNSLVVTEEETAKMMDDSACKVIGTGTVNVTERDGTCMLWRWFGISESTLQSNTHRSAQQRRMLDPSAITRRQS